MFIDGWNIYIEATPFLENASTHVNTKYPLFQGTSEKHCTLKILPVRLLDS